MAGNFSWVTRLVALVVLLAPQVVHSQDGGEKSRAKGRTILFVDDHEILYRSGTKRVLQQVKRQGRPVPALPDNWLEADLDLARLNAWLPDWVHLLKPARCNAAIAHRE